MRTHVVQKGDTLWKIAKQYGISFDELKRLNGHLANPDYVIPGMEILLPDNGSNGAGKAVTTRTTSYKEKLTEPFAPIEEQSAPAREVRSMKEEMTMPLPEKQTQPIEEVRPPKEQITQPIMPAPTPAPIPQIQPEVMPEFHFAPQFTFTQPMPQQMPIPQPIPQPMPQPIMIEVPKPEVKIEEKEVTKTEYVPVPQPYYVYVPYCPEPVKPPCPCKQQHHAPRPCGCGGMQHPMHMPVQQPMPIQHMEMPCGCNDSVPYNHMMMPYDSNFMQPQYFEPNYDIAPVMEDNDKDSTLPDWLVDSSSIPEVMGASQHGKGVYDDFLDDKDSQFSPSEHYGQYDMNYPSMHQMPYPTMPENFMPYQTMPENYMPYQSMPEHQMSQHYVQPPMPHTMMQHPHMMHQHMNYPTQPYYPNQYHNPSNLKPWSY